jgi:hypothetical protein
VTVGGCSSAVTVGGCLSAVTVGGCSSAVTMWGSCSSAVTMWGSCLSAVTVGGCSSAVTVVQRQVRLPSEIPGRSICRFVCNMELGNTAREIISEVGSVPGSAPPDR